MINLILNQSMIFLVTKYAESQFYRNSVMNFLSSDLFGNLSQLIAALIAFIGIFYTLKEMEKQRKITSITVEEMQKQRESSYYPHILFPQVTLHCIRVDSPKEKMLWSLSPIDINENNSQSLSNSFDLKRGYVYANNIGFGPAHSIKITWDIDYNLMLEVIHGHDPKYTNVLTIENFPEDHDPKTYLCHTRRITSNRSAVQKFSIENSSNIEFILPSSKDSNPEKISLPEYYLVLLSYYCPIIEIWELKEYEYFEEGEYLNSDYIRYNDAKNLTMNIRFKDIGGNEFSVNYLLIPELTNVTKLNVSGEEATLYKYSVNYKNLN